eukprot:g3613.t1
MKSLQSGLQKGLDAAARASGTGTGADLAAKAKGVAKSAAQGAVARAKGAVTGAAARAEGHVREVAVDVATKAVDVAVDAAARRLKQQMHDPYMPPRLARAVDGVIDGVVVPDLREAARYAAASGLRREVEDARLFAPAPACCAPGPLRWLRAFLLYHKEPYDRSVFGRLSDPWWWALTTLSCFPLWGVSQAFWVLLFLLKDKGDEFQLVNFVVGFKTAQFVAAGFVPLVLGAALAATCTTAEPPAERPAAHAGAGGCADDGPGTLDPTPYASLAFVAVQWGLAWAAVLLLPRSRRKGGHLFAVLPADARAGGGAVVQGGELARRDGSDVLSRRGGRIVPLLLLDLLAFAALAAAAGVVHAGDEPEWKKRSHYYWLRTAYGLCSLPWLVLKLPFMFTLVLHTMPTAYNRRGETVRTVGGSERRRIRERLGPGGGGGGCCGARVAPAEAI